MTWLSGSFLVAREDLDYDSEGWIPRPSDVRITLAAKLEDKMEKILGS